jgi:hypothetical protein
MSTFLRGKKLEKLTDFSTIKARDTSGAQRRLDRKHRDQLEETMI